MEDDSLVISISPELFRQICMKENHIQTIREKLYQKGVTCSLVLNNQCFKKWTSRKRAGALYRVYFKCTQPTCEATYVGHLNDRPTDSSEDMFFRLLGTPEHDARYKKYMRRSVILPNKSKGENEAKVVKKAKSPNAMITCKICNKTMLRSEYRVHQKVDCSISPHALVPLNTEVSLDEAPRCLVCFGQFLRTHTRDHSLVCKFISVPEEAIVLSQEDFENRYVFPLDEIDAIIVCPHCQSQIPELSHFHEHLVMEHGCCWRKRFSEVETFQAWFEKSSFEDVLTRRMVKAERDTEYQYYTCSQGNETSCKVFVRAYFKEKGVIVTFNNVHNHPISQRLTKRISRKCRSYIMQLINEGFSNRQILEAARSHFQIDELRMVKMSTIGSMRYRKFQKPWVNSAIDLDSLEQQEMVKSEPTEGNVVESTQVLEENTTEYYDDNMNFDDHHDDDDDAVGAVIDNGESEVVPNSRFVTDCSQSVKVETMDFSVCSIKTNMPARIYFREKTIPLMLRALDNPNVTDEQWTLLNEQAQVILKKDQQG